MRTITEILTWFIIAMVLFTLAFDMLSEPSTISNLTGMVVLVITIVISWETRCFTKIINKQKDEKNEK